MIDHRSKIRSTVRFAALTWGLIAVVLLALWAFGLFRDMGLDIAGTAALIIGVLLTCALGIGLMGLIFYSAQSDADQGAYRFDVEPSRPEPEEDRRDGDS